MVANEIPQIKGSVIGPDDPSYEEARKIWNGAISKRPALIARCADEEDGAAERAGDVLRFYRDFIAGAPEELFVFVVLRTAPGLDWVPEPLRGQPVVMLIPFWSGDPDQGEQLIEPLRRFGPPLLDLVERKPYLAHQGMFDAGVPHGWGYYWKSHDLPPLTDAAIAVLAEHAWRKRSPASYSIIFHLGGAITRLPTDATAYAGREAAHAININAAWTAGGPEHADVAWARAFFQALQPHSTGGVYVNFLTDEGEARVRAAYGPHFDRLTAIRPASTRTTSSGRTRTSGRDERSFCGWRWKGVWSRAR